MKKTISILAILFVSFFTIQAQQISLPKECVSILNKQFKGWKIAKISADIVDWHKKSKQPFEPNLIKGDWNGDKQMDYAVLIQKGKVRQTIAFIKKSGQFVPYKLDGEDYIGLMKRGEKDYDYETEKDFVYKNDAIFVGIFEKSGVSYIWRKGKFIALITSD